MVLYFLTEKKDGTDTSLEVSVPFSLITCRTTDTDLRVYQARESQDVRRRPDPVFILPDRWRDGQHRDRQENQTESS